MRSPTQLNKLINRIKSEGWTYPTEYAYVSDAFARIVIPSGRKGAGTIRTMEQANDYLIKKYGSEAILFTEEEYDEELTNLRSVLSDSLTYRDYMRKERQNMIEIIEEAMDNTGEYIDVRNISNEQMKDAIEHASRDAKNDSRGSPQFYEYLMAYLA